MVPSSQFQVCQTKNQGLITKNCEPRTILLVAGGTGGHIFPALGLATELKELKINVHWAGTARGMEKQIALSHNLQFHSIPAGQFAGAPPHKKVQSILKMTWGFFQSLSLLNRIRPDALIAAGGFVSTPLLLAARAKKTKFFLLEQNRIPGRVVRAFSRYAAKTFLTFPVQGQLPGPTLVTGTPLRKQLVKRAMKIPAPLVHVFQCQVPSSPNQEPGTMNQEPSTSASPTVLVLGGSQGARALNLAALDMAAVLTNLRFIILTGRRDYPEIKSLIRSSNCEIIDWTDHPEELYEQATLAVTRGGGLVLSELLLFGIPAIIIPFPFAADRHQYANALYLSEQGAAVLLEQSQLSGLVSLVRSLIADQRKLKEMRKKARSLAQPDATQKICSTILQELSLFPVSSSKSQEL